MCRVSVITPSPLPLTGEEVQQLRKVLTDFSFDLSQLQTQLDAAQREKSILQSKVIDMERMHVQVKEAMNADVVYLRKLNLQLVEQQMKGTCMYMLGFFVGVRVTCLYACMYY